MIDPYLLAYLVIGFIVWVDATRYHYEHKIDDPAYSLFVGFFIAIFWPLIFCLACAAALVYSLGWLMTLGVHRRMR